MLRLKIQNFENLPDGGPIQFEVDKRGFDIGREHHLDWTLPDPNRFISGKHCEIRYFDGSYWLYDVSTNGTFVNRSSRRVQSPYKLSDGDQLEIGEYIISVSVEGEEPLVEAPPEPQIASEDLWDVGEAPPPIDRRDLLPPVSRGSRAADFLSSFMDVPPVVEPQRPPSPRPSVPHAHPAPAFRDPWAPPAPPVHPPAAAPSLSPGQVPFAAEPFRGAAEVEPRPERFPAHAAGVLVPQPPALASAAASAQAGRALEQELLRQFAKGANIAPDVLSDRSAGEFMYELGVLMRLISAHLMQLLSARAAAKTLARSGNRTMIQQSENNPLKFMPSAEEAIRTMLSGDSGSYLEGRRAFERTFADLQSHQLATYAAMQQAVQELMEDLDPDFIEQEAGGSKKSLLGSNKSKLWEAYVTRWKAKAGNYENGMLDVFLMLFAEYYDKHSRQGR